MTWKIQGVLLDLDGTLLDTAPDLAAALNRLREEQGLEALPFQAIRPYVSHGAVATVRCGFPAAAEAEFPALHARFLEFYGARLVAETQLFPGFDAVLATLEARPMPWGIVTNKPGFLTEPLLAQLQLARRAACIVSGDTLPQRKPHPAPLLYAAKQLGLDPVNCVYVGDAERDVQAGRAAGMRTLVATFGYLGINDRPESWRADGLIAEPQELLRWLNGADHL
jgi:2-phosphoglycolate phosphatase